MSMIIVEGFEGERYSGSTAAAVVEEMRAAAFGGQAADGIRGYMRQVAKRVFEWNGKRVRTDVAAQFLDDLVKAEFIRKTAGASAADKED